MFLDKLVFYKDIDEKQRLEREADIDTIVLSSDCVDCHFFIDRNGDITKKNYMYNVLNSMKRDNTKIYIKLSYTDFLDNRQEDAIFYVCGGLMEQYDTIKYLQSEIPTMNPKFFKDHLELE